MAQEGTHQPACCGTCHSKKAESRGGLREKCGPHPRAKASGLQLRALDTAVWGRLSPRVFWHTLPRSGEPASSLTGGNGPASQGHCEDWMKIHLSQCNCSRVTSRPS